MRSKPYTCRECPGFLDSQREADIWKMATKIVGTYLGSWAGLSEIEIEMNIQNAYKNAENIMLGKEKLTSHE